MPKYLMEFLGTMFLVLAIGLTQDPLAIGLILASLIFMGGHVSRAHYNPAITLAFWMCGEMKVKDIPGYLIAQFFGAFVAMIIFHYLKGGTFALAPAADISFGQSILVEVLFTFILASVILSVATAKRFTGNHIYALAIGLTVTGIAYAGGPISGGAFNPAVGVGTILMDSIISGGSISNLLLYIIGPLAGAALAAVTFKFLNPIEK